MEKLESVGGTECDRVRVVGSVAYRGLRVRVVHRPWGLGGWTQHRRREMVVGSFMRAKTSFPRPFSKEKTLDPPSLLTTVSSCLIECAAHGGLSLSMHWH